MIKLRDYQKECIQAITKSEKQSRLIVMPTGSGKTITFLSYLINTGKKALILAHTVDLVRQTYEVLKSMNPKFHFDVLNKNTDLFKTQIIVSTIQSLMCGNTLKKLKNIGIDILIIDEAHHALSNSYLKAIQELEFNANKQKILLGFTATPMRGDTRNLNEVFEEEVYRKEIFELIEKGILTDIKGYRIKTGVNLTGIRTQYGDFSQSELTAVVNTEERNELALKSFFDICPNKKTIIFCTNIKHSEDIAKVFIKNGIKCKAVHGKLPRNKRFQIIEDFKKGNIQVITNCQLFTEGFDEPSIEAIIMARPTKSLPLYLQMMGRGIRISPGKKYCTLIELTDNSYQICSLPKLIHENADKSKPYRDGESLLGYNKDIRENHAEIISSDFQIHKLEFKPFELLEKSKSTKGMATENQIELLKKFKIDFVPPLSYSMASLMLKNHRRGHG